MHGGHLKIMKLIFSFIIEEVLQGFLLAYVPPLIN